MFLFCSSELDVFSLKDEEKCPRFSPSCGAPSYETQSCATSQSERDDSKYTGRNLKVRSVFEFVKIPSPDVHGHYPPLHPEPLYSKKPGIQRSELTLFTFAARLYERIFLRFSLRGLKGVPYLRMFLRD